MCRTVLAPNGTAPRIERRLIAKRVFDLVAGQRVLDGAARVLAVSRAEDRQLRAMGIPPASIRVIPNAVDLEECVSPPASGGFRARWGIDSEPLVVFLGKLTPRKRLDVVVRAIDRLGRRETRLVIAGNDMGSLGPTRALVHALGLDARVTFAGLLRGRERLEALADADVVVYPSEHEVFGLVPLEALLAGTPVIVAGDSGCGEIVGAVPGGQVVPVGEVDALARAIETVLEAPGRWREDAAASRTPIRSAYGAEVVCEQVERMYREMAADA